MAAQGVEDPWSAARRAHMVAIGQAEESVWIQSPYFVPDYSIYDVMINAALSGIDVRFMMTGIPDKPHRPLGGADLLPQAHRGGRRASSCTRPASCTPRRSSSTAPSSAVGTMNMDQRSLKLHKEMMVLGVRQGLRQQVADRSPSTWTNCHEVTLDDVLSVGRLKKFRNQAARLFSNVL